MTKKLVSLLLLLALLAGCAAAESNGVSLTDMANRAITLDAPATRIVALTASDCEILYALGAGDTLVGRGEYCDYPDAVLDVPVVNSGAETNLEQILSLRPQVVLMATMSQTKEQVAALENAGITVVVSNAQDIQGVYTAITMIGALVGKNDEANALVSQMQTAFDGISAKAESAGKTVYFEVSPLQYGLWTAGQGTFMDELATLCGLTNAFGDLTGWAEISAEQVLERNPDYIITVSMYYGEGPTPVEEIKSRDGWQSLKAVVNNDVFNAGYNEITRPGPRLMQAAEELYSFVCDDATEEPAA